MALSVQLPWEIEEDILARLPPSSLVRFRSVCKRWNVLSKEKWFTNKYLSRSHPQFIYLNNSKIFSIDLINLDGVDPTIDLHELAFPDIPYQDFKMFHTTISPVDGFLFCGFWHVGMRGGLWNPWLREFKWLEYETKKFQICGAGYDNTRSEKVYKFMGYFLFYHIAEGYANRIYHKCAIYNTESRSFKFIDNTSDETFPQWRHCQYHVSLNGNLYWIHQKPNRDELFIRCCDFSRDIFKPFCHLPCQKIHSDDEFALTVKAEAQFSLLTLYYETKKIEIWVTKSKIDDGDKIDWIKSMTFQPSNFPKIFPAYGLSYFIYDKTLIMCSLDHEIGEPTHYIYIVRRDMCKKIKIEAWYQGVHCVAAPSISRFF